MLCTVALIVQRSPPTRAESTPSAATRSKPEPVPFDDSATDPASVDALGFDVWRIVDAEESSGWLVDEIALQEVMADMMASVCSATTGVRREALRRAEAESAALGEPARVFEAEGRQLGEPVRRALSAWRRATVLRRAVRAAPDQCPFWVQPDPAFRGLQSTRDRWLLSFDTGGLVQFRRTESNWTLGAGGSGRLLVGYGFSHLTLLAGVEFGGGALLEPGSDPTEFLINYLPALPLVARLHRAAWHYDLEVTPVALFQARDTRLSYGMRGAVTVGVSALRVRGVIPWVGLGAAAEHYFENTARPRATYLRGGLRVGGVWGP